MKCHQNLNKILHGDCEKIIPTLENDTIDLLITSPPYNVNLKYNSYDDNKDYIEYINWLKNIFKALKPKMKKDGRLCINIGDKNNGKTPTHVFISNFMMEIGYHPLTTIIWNKKM